MRTGSSLVRLPLAICLALTLIACERNDSQGGDDGSPVLTGSTLEGPENAFDVFDDDSLDNSKWSLDDPEGFCDQSIEGGLLVLSNTQSSDGVVCLLRGSGALDADNGFALESSTRVAEWDGALASVAFVVEDLPWWSACGIRVARDRGVEVYANGSEGEGNAAPITDEAFHVIGLVLDADNQSVVCTVDGAAVDNRSSPSDFADNDVTWNISSWAANDSTATFEIDWVKVTD